MKLKKNKRVFVILICFTTSFYTNPNYSSNVRLNIEQSPTVTISLYKEYSGDTFYYWVNEAENEWMAYLQFNGSVSDSYIDCIEWWVDQRTGAGFCLYGTGLGGNRKRLKIDGSAVPGSVNIWDVKIRIRYELPPAPLPAEAWSPVFAVGAVGDDSWPIDPGLSQGAYFSVCPE